MGLRDENLFESALARPLNLFSYEGVTDIPRRAATYGFGPARNHAFIDGTKPAALLGIGLFLSLNGWRLTAPQTEVYDVTMRRAAGELDEAALADWIRGTVRPR